MLLTFMLKAPSGAPHQFVQCDFDFSLLSAGDTSAKKKGVRVRSQRYPHFMH